MPKNLKTYLLENGLTDLSPEELKKEKQKFRKQYLKDYKKQYFKKNIRVQLYFNLTDNKLIVEASKNQNKSVPNFVKKATLAYINQCFLLPDDSQVRSLEVGIRRIGNNINQIAFVANASSKVHFDDIVNLKQQLNKLEQIISEAFREPKTLAHSITEEAQKNPRFIALLKSILNSYDHDFKND